MAGMSRREFLEAGGASAALAFMAANGVKLKANPLGPADRQPDLSASRADCRRAGFTALLKDMKAHRHRRRRAVRSVELQGVRPLQDAKTHQEDARRCRHQGHQLPRRHEHLPQAAQRRPELGDGVGLTQLSTADLGGTTKDGVSRLSNGITTPAWIKEAADEYNAIAADDEEGGPSDRAAQRGLLQLADGRWPVDLPAPDRGAGSGARRDAVPDVVDDEHGQSDHCTSRSIRAGSGRPTCRAWTRARACVARRRRRCRTRTRRRPGAAAAAVVRLRRGPAAGLLRPGSCGGGAVLQRGAAAGGAARRQAARAMRRRALRRRGRRPRRSVGRRRHRELAGRVHRGQDRRHEELLHRAVVGADGEERRVPEDAQRHVASDPLRMWTGRIRGGFLLFG